MFDPKDEIVSSTNKIAENLDKSNSQAKRIALQSYLKKNSPTSYLVTQLMFNCVNYKTAVLNDNVVYRRLYLKADGFKNIMRLIYKASWGKVGNGLAFDFAVTVNICEDHPYVIDFYLSKDRNLANILSVWMNITSFSLNYDILDLTESTPLNTVALNNNRTELSDSLSMLLDDYELSRTQAQEDGVLIIENNKPSNFIWQLYGLFSSGGIDGYECPSDRLKSFISLMVENKWFNMSFSFKHNQRYPVTYLFPTHSKADCDLSNIYSFHNSYFTN